VPDHAAADIPDLEQMTEQIKEAIERVRALVAEQEILGFSYRH
jgi:hypothetical protein